MPFRPQNSRFWHYDFQLQGRRFHGSCGTEDFETAKGIEAQARVDARTALHHAAATKGVFTLSEAIGTYYADICDRQPSARTSLSQGKAILQVFDRPKRLDQLTDADLLHYVARRRATVSNATANRELQFLGRALRHMAHYHAATVPVLDWKRPQAAEPEERVRELTWDEQAALFAALRTDLHPLVKFALMTGARRATICGLRWRDVDLATSRMRFALKGGRTMAFPVNREMQAFLGSLPRSDLPSEKPFVLTYVDQTGTARHRRRISPSGGGVHDDFHKAVLAAGIEDFRFHDLRHTFATRMLRQTGNLKLVSRLLGHTSIETTMRYAHVLDADLAEAMAGFRVAPILPERKRHADE
jgi:integrase